MRKHGITIILGSLLGLFMAAVLMILISPPVSITVIGKPYGRKCSSEIECEVKIQNNRPWTIYSHGEGGGISASYRISERTDFVWHELSPGEYMNASPVVRESIPPRGSTTIRVHPTETETSKESRIGLDCYSLWDCEMRGWKWSRPLSFPTTAWSMPQHIDFKRDPREIHIMVEEDRTLSIARTRLSIGMLALILKKVSAENGQDTPIVIFSRKGADPQKVSPIVDLCTSIGLKNTVQKTLDAPIVK